LKVNNIFCWFILYGCKTPWSNKGDRSLASKCVSRFSAKGM